MIKDRRKERKRRDLFGRVCLSFRGLSYIASGNSVLMDFFKIKKFGKGKKSAGGGGEAVESDDDASVGDVTPRGMEEQKPDNGEGNNAEEAAVAAEGAGGGNGVVEEEEYEEDDDDFITNEVKRRLKELRKNSFMVLIPEEECAEVEDDGEEEEGGSPREWLEAGVGDGFPLCGFDSLYDKYCERMMVFHKMIAQLMKDPGKDVASYGCSPLCLVVASHV